MKRRVSAALVAITALAALALLPAVASAQSPPPTVAGVVIEETTTTAPPQGDQTEVAGETLVRTGSEVLPMVGIALALVVVGALLVVSVRRRRTNDVGLA